MLLCVTSATLRSNPRAFKATIKDALKKNQHTQNKMNLFRSEKYKPSAVRYANSKSSMLLLLGAFALLQDLLLPTTESVALSGKSCQIELEVDFAEL